MLLPQLEHGCAHLVEIHALNLGALVDKWPVERVAVVRYKDGRLDQLDVIEKATENLGLCDG